MSQDNANDDINVDKTAHKSSPPLDMICEQLEHEGLGVQTLQGKVQAAQGFCDIVHHS